MLLNIPGAAIEDDSAEWTEVADSLDNLTVELPGEHETTSPAIEAPEEIDLKDDDPDDPLFNAALEGLQETPSKQTDRLLDTAQQPRSNEVPLSHDQPRSEAANAQHPAEDPRTDKPQWTGAQSFLGNNKSPEMQQPSVANNIPTYNILLLGQTQSGKSTFLQAIRKYADPNCQIDEETIGDGNSSHTKEVLSQLVETNFPEYRLYGKGIYHQLDPRNYMDMPSQQEPVEKEVNFSEYIGPRCTAKEFKKKINREDLSVRKDEILRYPQCFIRVLDTPGLDDTNGHDERNVAKILSSLSTAGDIHLVLIMISRHTAMLPGLQAALKTYSKIFSSMGSLIAFVHTQVDFQTHADAKLKTFLETRKRDLLSIMGRDIPQYIIDCDLEDDLPVHIYLRQRIIQSLLLLTRFNIPVSLKRMQLYKTKKMMEVDELIHKEQKKNLQGVQEKIEAVMKKMKNSANNVIADINSNVNATRYKIRELEEYIRNNDTEDLELIHEDRFHENWELFSFRQEIVLESPPLICIIDTIREDMTGIEMKERHGGESFSHWRVKMVRQFFQEGTYHAKLFTHRRRKHHEKIMEQRADLKVEMKELEVLIFKRDVAEKADEADMADEATKAERQQLEDDRSRCLDMIARASRPTLHLNLFKAIAEVGAYEGTFADCLDRVMKFYSTYIPAEGEEVPLEQDETPRREL